MHLFNIFQALKNDIKIFKNVDDVLSRHFISLKFLNNTFYLI